MPTVGALYLLTWLKKLCFVGALIFKTSIYAQKNLKLLDNLKNKKLYCCYANTKLDIKIRNKIFNIALAMQVDKQWLCVISNLLGGYRCSARSTGEASLIQRTFCCSFPQL